MYLMLTIHIAMELNEFKVEVYNLIKIYTCTIAFRVKNNIVV